MLSPVQYQNCKSTGTHLSVVRYIVHRCSREPLPAPLGRRWKSHVASLRHSDSVLENFSQQLRTAVVVQYFYLPSPRFAVAASFHFSNTSRIFSAAGAQEKLLASLTLTTPTSALLIEEWILVPSSFIVYIYIMPAASLLPLSVNK